MFKYFLCIIMVCLFFHFNLGDFSKIVTIIGTIAGLYIAYSYNNNYKNQKELQIMQIKREYYNKFLAAFIKKMNYCYPKLSESLEAVQANEKFCIEASRLTMYASKDVIECVAKIQKGENVNPEELILLIRKDLGFCDIEKIPLNLVVSDLVVINGEVVDKKNLSNKNTKN
jgi:hypothetical protein